MTLSAHHLEKAKGFRSTAGAWDLDKLHVFLIINYNITESNYPSIDCKTNYITRAPSNE